jgi:hypothetical protein
VSVLSSRSQNKFTKPEPVEEPTEVSLEVQLTELSEEVPTIGSHCYTHEQKKQDLFDEFTTMTFTEVRIRTIPERIVNVCNVFKFMIGLLEYIPVLGAVVPYLQLPFQVLSWVFRLFVSPLKILSEARDGTGQVTLFMITDGRSFFARTVGLNLLANMELTRFDPNKDSKTLMFTQKERAFDCCCCSGFCCVPAGCCNRIKRLKLLDTATGELAARPYRRCQPSCHPCETTHDLLTFTKGMEQDIRLVEKSPGCSYGSGKGNRIVPASDDDGVHFSKKKKRMPLMMVTRNTFSLRDFLMEHAAMALEEFTDSTVDEAEEGLAGKLGEDTVERLAGMIKENVEAFKELGYQKIKTSESKWEVEFPTDFTHTQKCAVVLFVLEKYMLRL